MSQESAKITDLPEQSPVAQARAKLGAALEQLEATVIARMEEAARLAASTPEQSDDGDSEQWKNACRLLEEQLASLKEDNSQLHSELHQMRSKVQSLQQHNDALTKANAEAADSLGEAIEHVEQILKG